jgi:hypothetical protein
MVVLRMVPLCVKRRSAAEHGDSPRGPGWAQYHRGMPFVEILDGPPEWAGTVYETDEDDLVEFGLPHPRWVRTPVGLPQGALYTYRMVEVVGDRLRYRYLGPWPPHRAGRSLGPDLTGWDVLVVQQELYSDDRRKLWGSPIRVYAAPPGVPRPDPARPPEEQGWQELTEGGWPRQRHPGQGAFLQQRLARWMAEGNPWVVEHWQRLANTQGAAKDAEAERIDDEHVQLARLAEAARVLRRLRPEVVVSWSSDPPFPATATYVPVIGQDLASIPELAHPEWVAMQDRALLVVWPRAVRGWGAGRLGQGVRRPARDAATGSVGRARAAGLE